MSSNPKNDNDDDVILQQVVAAATVGSPYILNAPNVKEPPSHINQPIPVPSCYCDERGEIHNLLIGRTSSSSSNRSSQNVLPDFIQTRKPRGDDDNDGKRINILYSKAGVMRAGDIHAVVQHDFVFSGQVLVWILKADGSTQKTLYSNYEYIIIPAYTPHIFEFVTDTVLAEWWDGPFYAWYYEPYRNIVQSSFTTTTSTTTKRGGGGGSGGSFSLYKLVSPMEESSSASNSGTLQEIILPFFQNKDHQQQQLLLLWTGMAIGLSLGYLLGRQRR